MLEPAGDMRARIMAIARELYVLRGYDGFSFGDIAESVPTTRANIHHHYGTKRRLIDELIDGFVADAEALVALPRSFATMSNDDQVTWVQRGRAAFTLLPFARYAEGAPRRITGQAVAKPRIRA